MSIVSIDEFQIIPRTSMAARFVTDAERWAAMRARDSEADGHFFCSVATTGVYCYPSCAARTPKRENVAFFDTRAEAERAGFRACKRCRPDLPPKAEREAALIEESCRRIESAEELPKLEDLAREAGLSPHHFHRLFKRVTGVTPKAYAAHHRQKLVQASLAAGAGVTESLYASGFNSSGRFYEAAPAMLGMTPSAYRKGGEGEIVQYGIGRSSLGMVLVAMTEVGVCAIVMADDAASLEAELERRFPRAELVEAGPDFNAVIGHVVKLMDDPVRTRTLDLPLDIRGTAFQRKVWEKLREIPLGETASYAEIARRTGNPKAFRAVANACGANPLAVAIPCHRAVASGGGLGGYRYGVERKRKLLSREKA